MIFPRSLIFLPGLDQVGSTPASRPVQPRVPGEGGSLSGGRLGGFLLGTWPYKVMGIPGSIQDQVTDPDLQLSILS